MIDCPHADRCSGCQYLALPYPEQLARKRARLVNQLALFPETRALPTEEPRGAKAQVGYRTRAKWMVGPRGELGLFAKASEGDHVVVDIPGCRVLPAALLATGDALRALLAERPPGFLRAVDARHAIAGGVERVLVTLITPPKPPTQAELRAFAETLRARVPAIAGVAESASVEGAVGMLGEGPSPLLGASEADDEVGTRVRATFGAFVQASREQARVLIDLAAEALPRGARSPRVLDVFGGSGAFSLALAERGADVELIESFAPAAALAERTARARHLPVRAHAGDATALLADARTEPFDLVIVNPPRRGVARAAREALAATELGKLVYVSCEPRTLARDLAHFARLGLAPTRIVPVDMMPHTEEVETVAVLARAPAPPPRVLFEDDDLVAIDKDPYEPTTPQGEHARSLLDRVRALPGCATAQPIHRLDRDTSGVCLFAKRASAVHGFARALAADDAEKTYLALATGLTHGKGRIDKPLVEAGRTLPVSTRYRRVRSVGGHSLLEVAPREGKKHQIRRHLAAIGHPIVGDERYGDAKTTRYFFEKFGLDRAFLHCHRLTLTHPHHGAPLALVSPLPDTLADLLETLGTRRPKASRNPATRR